MIRKGTVETLSRMIAFVMKIKLTFSLNNMNILCTSLVENAGAAGGDDL